MIVVCIGCRRQGLPSVQRELMPYEDTRLLATLCLLHQEELRARLRALAAQTRAQAEGEPGA